MLRRTHSSLCKNCLFLKTLGGGYMKMIGAICTPTPGFYTSYCAQYFYSVGVLSFLYL